MKRLLAAILISTSLTTLFITGCQQPIKPQPVDLDEIAAIAEHQIADGNIPGAVVLVGQDDDNIYHRAFGSQIIEPHNEPTTRQTIYDLASLTKPIATATKPPAMVLVFHQS